MHIKGTDRGIRIFRNRGKDTARKKKEYFSYTYIYKDLWIPLNGGNGNVISGNGGKTSSVNGGKCIPGNGGRDIRSPGGVSKACLRRMLLSSCNGAGAS